MPVRTSAARKIPMPPLEDFDAESIPSRFGGSLFAGHAEIFTYSK
jgi:hypothetical protein